VKELDELIDELQEIAEEKGRDCTVNVRHDGYEGYAVVGRDEKVYKSIKI